VLVESTVFSSEPDGYRGKIEQFSLCTAERELLGGVDERRTVRSLRDSQVVYDGDQLRGVEYEPSYVLELFSIPWQDFALAIGGVVGTYSKLYALYDTDTVWSRKSSLPNAVFFVPTVVAFVSLGLPLTTLTSTMSFFIWSGVYLWRAPDDEDWLGRSRDN